MREKYIYDIETYPNNYKDSWVYNSNPKQKLKDVLNDYSTEEIIEAMGIEKVQNYLRKKKIQNIKNE